MTKSAHWWSWSCDLHGCIEGWTVWGEGIFSMGFSHCTTRMRQDKSTNCFSYTGGDGLYMHFANLRTASDSFRAEILCCATCNSRENSGKVQTKLFRYRFMNLIFMNLIFNSKRGGGRYWREVLFKKNIVYVYNSGSS